MEIMMEGNQKTRVGPNQFQNHTRKTNQNSHASSALTAGEIKSAEAEET